MADLNEHIDQQDSPADEDRAYRELMALVRKAEQKEQSFLAAYQNAPLPLIFREKLKAGESHNRFHGCIIAPSTRKGPCQATFFDANGFLSDTNGTKEECLKECINIIDHPEPFPEESFQKLATSANFLCGNLISKYIHSLEDQDSPSARQILIDFCEKPKAKDDPIQLYRWLYRQAMERKHIISLPLAKGYGGNIDAKTRMKLTGSVFSDHRWQKLSEEQKKASLKGEPYLSKEILDVIFKEHVKGYAR